MSFSAGTSRFRYTISPAFTLGLSSSERPQDSPVEVVRQPVQVFLQLDQLVHQAVQRGVTIGGDHRFAQQYFSGVTAQLPLRGLQESFMDLYLFALGQPQVQPLVSVLFSLFFHCLYLIASSAHDSGVRAPKKTVVTQTDILPFAGTWQTAIFWGWGLEFQCLF